LTGGLRPFIKRGRKRSSTGKIRSRGSRASSQSKEARAKKTSRLPAIRYRRRMLRTREKAVSSQ